MIKGQIDILWKGDEAIKDVERACSQVLEGAAVQVQIQAQRHVQIGIGPGPHPHLTPHEDTGWLMEHIEVGDEYKEGETLVREVGNTEEAPYGKYLEVGYTSKGGRFVRYPWLWPALELRIGDIRQMASGMKL